MDITKIKGKSGLYLCCEDRRNREEQYLDDEKMEICRKCGRKHYELSVDTGRLGIMFYGAK